MYFYKKTRPYNRVLYSSAIKQNSNYILSSLIHKELSGSYSILKRLWMTNDRTVSRLKCYPKVLP